MATALKKHTLRTSSAIICTICGALPPLLTADIHAEDTVPATQPAETAESLNGATTPRGPRYAPLRYDDDFSYLGGPEDSYTPDFFDPIKRIPLGDAFTLRLGGEVRGRFESVDNKRYGAGPRTDDNYFLHRYYYHADLRYGDLARFFVEGVNAAVEDNDGSPIPRPSEHFDIHQMFIDFRILGENVPLTLRIGRQELLYGRQRLISPLDWANVRRTWDGVKVLWSDENLDIDAWYVSPVELRKNQPNKYDENVAFYGVYATLKAFDRHGIDAYYLALLNDGPIASANLPVPPSPGDMTLHTLGSRLWGNTPVGTDTWDYETEFAGQWGRRSGDVIQAWMASAETGYRFEACPWQPRIGFGLDYASGDRSPYDGSHQTFNQLFPLGHAYFGYLDQIGRQNLWAQHVNVDAKPHEDVTAGLAWHTFWLDRNRDALYNAGGAAVRRDPTGQADSRIGHELDLTLTWQVDVHLSLLFGYSHLWTGPFIDETGTDSDPDLFYVQYQYKF